MRVGPAGVVWWAVVVRARCARPPPWRIVASRGAVKNGRILLYSWWAGGEETGKSYGWTRPCGVVCGK